MILEHQASSLLFYKVKKHHLDFGTVYIHIGIVENCILGLVKKTTCQLFLLIMWIIYSHLFSFELC